MTAPTTSPPATGSPTRTTPTTSRRSLLAGGLVVAGATLLPAGWAQASPAASAVSTAGGPLRAYPFTLGIASGDPLPDGVVLWTRLAVDPLAADGFGGMPSRDIDLRYQVATDDRFRRIVQRGVVTARAATAHTVHVELQGLEPGREYWYRFRLGAEFSPVGHTRTAPAVNTRGGALAMSFVSCAQYEHGYFTAYRRLAQDEPDLILHLGDYFYEYKANDYVAPSGNVRDAAGPETTDLAGYRQRHAQYKTDLDLQAAHAVAPWIPVWDDHEVDNNWADEVPEDDESTAVFLRRRAAAFQAYYENMPLRTTSKPNGIDAQMYRRLQWGQLATFHMLDTRQYRSDQASGDGVKPDSPERTDPRRSITGATQERWLLDGLGASRSTWDVIGQQVFFAQSDFAAGPVEAYNMDAWDGYAASRDRLIHGGASRGVANPVVLTGDIHSNWANELKADFDDPHSKTFGVELVTTSITSGGDGSEVPSFGPAVLAENPHIKYTNNRRGYVNTRITDGDLRADFRVVPYVSQPGAPVATDASFVVDAGNPGLRRVATS